LERLAQGRGVLKVPKWSREQIEFTVSVITRAMHSNQMTIPKPIFQALGSPKFVTYEIKNGEVLLKSTSSRKPRPKNNLVYSAKDKESLGRLTDVDNPSDLAEKLLLIDDDIRVASITTVHGQILARTSKRGHVTNFSKSQLDKYGGWNAILISVAKQFDNEIATLDFLVLGRPDFKGVLIPFDSQGFILGFTLEKGADVVLIVQKAREYVRSYFEKAFVRSWK